MSGSGTGKGTRFSKILSINSNDRQPGIAGDRSTNFVVNLGQNLQECSGISYKGCTFYNNFYNVRAAVTGNVTFNNRYTWAITGLSVSTNEAPGYYSASALLTQMISEITTAALPVVLTLSFTISPTTGLITFNFVNSSAVGDFFTVNDTLLAVSGANTGFGPWEMLGFPTVFSLNEGQSITASFMPSMGGITQMNIQSRALAPANAYREDSQVSDWFQIIPVEAPWQGFNVNDCKVDVLCELNYDRPRTLNVIDIVLVDHDGNEVNLNGSPFNLDIRVWYNNTN